MNMSISLCVLLLLLSSLCHVSLAGRKIPSSAPSTVVRPLAAADQDDPDFVSLRPRLGRKEAGLRGGLEFRGCLPKGFRRASAPSRFVNYHPLGGCNTSGGAAAVGEKKP